MKKKLHTCLDLSTFALVELNAHGSYSGIPRSSNLPALLIWRDFALGSAMHGRKIFGKPMSIMSTQCTLFIIWAPWMAHLTLKFGGVVLTPSS